MSVWGGGLVRNALCKDPAGTPGCYGKVLLTSAQAAEVFSCLGHDVGVQLHHNPAQRAAIGGHVEEDTGLGLRQTKDKVSAAAPIWDLEAPSGKRLRGARSRQSCV